VRSSCSFVLLFSLAAPSWAASPNEGRAKALYEKGRAQFDARDYTGAIASFDLGYQLSPRALFLFNMAQSLRKLSELHPDDLDAATRARDEYRRYIDQASLDEPERVDALRHLMELEARLNPAQPPSPALTEGATVPPAFVEQPKEKVEAVEPSHAALWVTLAVVAVVAVGTGTGIGIWAATRCQASLGCADARR
jgi:hypothetical protein